MLKLVLKSQLALIVIPALTLAALITLDTPATFAIVPRNPVTFCERFLGDADKAACTDKMTKLSVDWYAASACSLQDDDKNFYQCIDEIKDASFNPEAVEVCAKAPDISDSARLNCLRNIKNKDFRRADLTRCEGKSEPRAVAACLTEVGSVAKARKPASSKDLPGFQTLQIHR